MVATLVQLKMMELLVHAQKWLVFNRANQNACTPGNLYQMILSRIVVFGLMVATNAMFKKVKLLLVIRQMIIV